MVDLEGVLQIGNQIIKTSQICNLNVIIFVTVDNNYEQNQFGRIKTS
jgi:hypothetical protein